MPPDSAADRPAGGRRVGARLGHYRLDAFIGAGGMGEVYRGRDVRLDRDVAVKVLPPEFAADPGRLQRFDQEARAVAALNHPNILALHDIGSADGLTFIVTELLEGRTLRDLLAAERLTVRRAVGIATQIAEGLAAAHARGIVHRDLKPENLFVTRDGVVKILDFGLAKDTTPASAQATRSATTPHAVVGTPGYMSPEQVRGQATDRRADVFAFGAVLHEMLNGEPAFRGDSAGDLMSAILRDAPPALLSTSDRPIPPALASIVERCLDKSPEARFESTRDLAFALKALSTSDSRMTTREDAVQGPSGRTRRTTWFVAAAGAAAVLLALAVWQPWRARPAVLRFSWPLEDMALSGVFHSFALAPDASGLVYAGRHASAAGPGPRGTGATPGAGAGRSGGQTPVARAGGAGRAVGGAQGLFFRSLRAFDASPIGGTSAGDSPFLSPDGAWLGFLLRRSIVKVPVAGGEPVVVQDLTKNFLGASWGSDDWIVYCLAGGELWRVRSSGGSPERLALAGVPDDLGIAWPQALDGGAVLFTGQAQDEAPSAMLRMPDGSVTTLAFDAIHAQFAAPGFLVFARGGSLMATRLDLRRPDAATPAVKVLDGVAGSRHWAQYYSHFHLAPDGSLAYAPGALLEAPGRSELWVDRADGREEPWPFGAQLKLRYRLSPDGSRVAMGLPAANQFGPLFAEIWIGDFARGTKQRLTDDAVGGFAWVDDDRVVYAKKDGSLWWRRVDRGGTEVRVAPAGPAKYNLDVTRDGTSLVWSAAAAGDRRRSELWTMTGANLGTGPGPAAGPAVRRLHDDAASRTQPRFSPDGKWLAYIADGTLQVEAFPGPGAVVTVSETAVGPPMWTSNELLWIGRPGAGSLSGIMGVTYRAGAFFRPGAARLVRAGPPGATFVAGEVSPDGRRFVASRRDADSPPPPGQINIIVNWVEELKQRIR